MSNPLRRCTLHKTHIEELKQFLNQELIPYRDGKGPYQVLQVKTQNHGWQVIFSKNIMLEHYSVNNKLMPIIRKFYMQANKKLS